MSTALLKATEIEVKRAISLKQFWTSAGPALHLVHMDQNIIPEVGEIIISEAEAQFLVTHLTEWLKEDQNG